MMSNNVSESEKEIPTGCVSFYTQWFDVCVCIRVRGLHLVGSRKRTAQLRLLACKFTYCSALFCGKERMDTLFLH